MPQVIRFVAIVGPSNSLAYLKSFDDTNETKALTKGEPAGESPAGIRSEVEPANADLKYHFLAHMAFDYVVGHSSYSESPRDCSLLLVHDGTAVYGCSSNTNTKFLIATDAQETIRYDLRPAFRAVQNAYISFMCNPFRHGEADMSIHSAKFDVAIDKMAQAWNNRK